MSSRELEDRMEEETRRLLAQELGVSFEELEGADFDIEPIESNDGLTYYNLVTFGEDTPTELLEKVNANQYRSVRIRVNAFDDDEVSVTP